MHFFGIIKLGATDGTKKIHFWSCPSTWHHKYS